MSTTSQTGSGWKWRKPDGSQMFVTECRDCYELVVTHQPAGIGGIGKLCDDCRVKSEEARADNSRRSMARLRRKRYSDRDEMYLSGGGKPPRQGVPGVFRGVLRGRKPGVFPWESSGSSPMPPSRASYIPDRHEDCYGCELCDECLAAEMADD